MDEIEKLPLSDSVMQDKLPVNVTERMAGVAHAMIRGERKICDILDAFSVSEEEFGEWIRGGVFSDYASSLARGYAEAVSPYFVSLLLDMAKGNVQAIKLYFDILNKKQQPAAAEGKIPAAGEDITALREDIFGENT